jgi:hypothetical protein
VRRFSVGLLFGLGVEGMQTDLDSDTRLVSHLGLETGLWAHRRLQRAPFVERYGKAFSDNNTDTRYGVTLRFGFGSP